MTVTDKSKANLITKDLSKRDNHKELSAKGGQAKTEAKKLSAVFRELEKKGLTPEQAHFIGLVKEGKISELIRGLLAELISEPQTKKTKFYSRLAIIDKAIKMQEAERQIAPTNLTQINNYFLDDERLRKFYNNLRRAESPTMDTGNTGNNTVPVPDKVPD